MQAYSPQAVRSLFKLAPSIGATPASISCRSCAIAAWKSLRCCATHVLKLFLRPLQPLAQVLDVFIVQLVLLFVHFQQRPQDFDATLFLHHTLSVFKLAYNSSVSGIRRCSSLVVICCFHCCWFRLHTIRNVVVTDKSIGSFSLCLSQRHPIALATDKIAVITITPKATSSIK